MNNAIPASRIINAVSNLFVIVSISLIVGDFTNKLI
jgi:hypothetical protein